MRQSKLFTKTLKKGEENEEIRGLQEFLKKFPDIYPEGLASGFFGPATKTAVQKLQTKYGIVTKQDIGYGYVGPKTREVLNRL